MPDYLSTKDWRSVLDQKEHKSVKKTGVSETLEDYASAKKKDDLGKMVSALERIIQKADEVKTAQSKFPKLESFLADMVKAAKTEQQKLAPRLGDLAEKEDEDNEDSTLGKALAKIRQVDVDSAWNFVLVPGKPSSGLVVSKKTLKKSDTEKAFEMKGKRGPFFTGRIYFDAAKFVLDLGLEVSPVPGLAKAAKNAALLHAEMNIKVVVRGAGKEIDGDTDIEPMEEGTGNVGPQPLGNQGQRGLFADRIQKLNETILRFISSPNAKVEGAADGLYGAIRLLREQIEGATQDLRDDKGLFLGQLRAMEDILAEGVEKATQGTAPKPSAKYPTEADWQKLAEQVVRLDPTKRKDGWERYKARLGQMIEQFKADKDLVDPERTQVLNALRRAGEIGKEQAGKANDLAESSETKNPELTRRFEALERRYDQVLKAPGLDPAQAKRLTDAFTGLRDQFRRGELTLDDPRLPQLERVLEQLAKNALQKQQEASLLQGQQEMHQSLSKAMPFLKKAALPVGMVKDPEAIRAEVGTNTNLRLMLEAMTKAAKAPDAKTGKEMETTARTLLADAAERRKQDREAWVQQQEDQGTNDPFPEPEKSPGELLAIDVLKRAQMMQLVAQYDGLGAPPWDPGKADLASELQAQLFFLETAIQSGTATHEAPKSGDLESGTSGSWWIERTEPEPGGKGSQKKKYIFKPGQTEDGIIVGVPKGSGAPREVLAKRLDEVMTGAGFNVGVSPTTLGSIDSTQLGGLRPDQGPMLGSMQQLAPSDGSFKKVFEDKKLGEFSKTLDKRNFDDIAVFDMMFGNLDRHPGNLLFKTDPDTGKNQIVPIDHGASLPDPDALQLNMSSVLSVRNIMANKEIEQTQTPIGAETLEALNRLDPDELARQMKQSRDDMGNRHPEAKGKISDEAIDAMAARVRFLKLAAPTVPVATLFQMLALGAKRIALARPEDLPDLVESLKQEALELEEGMQTKDEVLDELEAAGIPGSMNALKDQLQTLGWAWNLATSDIDEWVARNGKLVTRILKTRMVNPALQSEINRLLPQARRKDDKLDDKIAGKPPVQVYQLAYDAANRDIALAIDKTVPTSDLTREFEQLGGLPEWKKALETFPVIDGDIQNKPLDTPERVQDYWAQRTLALRQWAAFKAKGGVPELLRLGATLPRELKPLAAVRMIDEMVASAQATSDLLALDDEEVDEAVANNYAAMQNEATDELRKVRSPSERGKFTKLRNVSQDLWQRGKVAAALTFVGRAIAEAKKRLVDEAAFIVQVDKKMEDMRRTVENSDQQVKAEFGGGVLDAILETMEDSKEETDLGLKGRGEREFAVRLEIAQKGDQSDYAVKKKALEAQEVRVQSHAGYPWHRALSDKLDTLKELLEIYDLGNLGSQGKMFDISLNSVDLMKAALGNTDLGNLPLAVQQLIAPWTDRIKNSSQHNRGQETADLIREALQQPVN